MKEITFVLDTQLTTIQTFEDGEEIMSDEEIIEYMNDVLKRRVDFDDVVIKKIQRFEQEVVDG